MTFMRPTNKTDSRAQDILHSGISLRSTAASWNTYCTATLPYPCSIVLPDKSTVKAYVADHDALFAGGWAKTRLAAGLGACLTLRASPRCPDTCETRSGYGASARPLRWSPGQQEGGRPSCKTAYGLGQRAAVKRQRDMLEECGGRDTWCVR